MKFLYFFLGTSTSFLLIYLFMHNLDSRTSDGAIIDSNMNLLEALGNSQIPESIKDQLTLVNVRYYSFDNKVHQGQIIINKRLANETVSIFNELLEKNVPIEKIVPVSYYKNSDQLSMQDNNTSSFNFRKIKGKNRFSKHAYGVAIDINPLFNPFIGRGVVMPSGGRYDPSNPKAITKDSAIYRVFKRHGWKWGGDWNTIKDYQHFEKAIQ